MVVFCFPPVSYCIMHGDHAVQRYGSETVREQLVSAWFSPSHSFFFFFFFESKHLLWHHVHCTHQIIDLSLVCLLFITICPPRAKLCIMYTFGQGDIMMYFKVFKMTHNSPHYHEINHEKEPEIVCYYNILQLYLK